MKILTIISNVMLLGLACIGLLTRGSSSEPLGPVFTFLILFVPIQNIVFMLGSRADYNRLSFGLRASETFEEIDKTSSRYLIIKIIAILFNLVLTGFFCWALKRDYPNPKTFIVIIFFLGVTMTPVFSTITILISRANKFKGVKRTLIISGASLATLLFCFILAMRIWIGNGIRERINIAKAEYSGIAEDALIAYLADSTHTPRERTDVAVCTLGQIRSQKALPILKKLYTGEPCHHNTELCQYEIHKAIVSIEHNWLGTKEQNVFGSWARLNK